jgi:uncharacterized protein (DUF1330 family)
MTAYFVVSARVTDANGLAEYRKRLGPILKQFGCRVIAADAAFEVIEGQWDGDSVVIIEAPDAAAIKSLQTSEAYAPLKRLRQASSISNAIVVAGT